MICDQNQSIVSKLGILGLLISLIAPAWAGTVYLDTFDGGNYELNGTAPDIAPSGVLWEAGSEFLADGSLGSQCTAVLPFEPEIGEVYQLIAEFDQDGDWAAVGFFDEKPEVNARMLDNALLWGLVRENGDTESDQVFMGPGTGNGLGNASTSSAAEIKIQLETTSETEWTVTWIFDGSEDFQETINPADYPIHYVAFGVNGYYSTVSGEILSFELRDSSNPNMASNPTPAEEATDVYVQETLKWIPGAAAETRNVYLSTDIDSVAAGSVDALVAEGLDVNELALDEAFELGVTYYWRVDEVNGAPDYGVTEGKVWSFTAEPVSFPLDGALITATASSYDETKGLPSSTIDSNGLDENDRHNQRVNDMWFSASDDVQPWIQYDFNDVVVLDKMWVWNSNSQTEFYLGFGIKSAMIEVSVDGNEWTVVHDDVILDKIAGSGKTGVTSEVDLGAIKASSVRITALSTWTALPGITQCSLSEVRFFWIPTHARLPEPQDGASVNNMSTRLNWRSARDVDLHDLYLGTEPNGLELISSSPEVGYEMTSLEYDRTYYWRVDEVIGQETYTGPDWTFSTQAYVVIDDMESYTNDEGSRVYDTWSDDYDGYKDGQGAMAGHEDAPYAESTIVHSGSQSMPMYYALSSNGDAVIAMDLDGANWTAGGLSTLTMFVLGDRESTGSTTLFVELDGKRQTADAYLAGGLWTQVNFSLAGFGTNLSSIDEMVIGVEGSGEGHMFIDDIRLYREAPAVVPPSDPGDDNLVLWYQMEGNLSDSAGNYDGTSETTLFYQDSLEGLGDAVALSGVDDFISMPIDSMVAGLGDSSFLGWVQIDEESTGAWQRLFDIGTDNTNYLFLCPRRETAGNVRAAIRRTDDTGETGMNSAQPLSDGWHHLGVTFDSGAMSLYVDGWSVGSVETDITPQTMGATTQNWLGKSQWESDALLEGLLDEFRIYDRGLSEAEVRYIAGDR